jgi:predicted PurR-regulated permease PerM
LHNTLKSVKPWVTFAGGVLIVAVLYWAPAVLVPFAPALLLTFVLTPPVTWLQRWVGRVPGVLLVVTLVFADLGLAGGGLTWQMDYLAPETLSASRHHRRIRRTPDRARPGGAISGICDSFT